MATRMYSRTRMLSWRWIVAIVCILAILGSIWQVGRRSCTLASSINDVDQLTLVCLIRIR